MNKVKKAVEILDLRRPFRIVISSKEHKECDGMYYAIYSEKKRNLSHLVKVWAGNGSRSLDAAIIHELIHGWQEENGLTEYHGPEFRRMARMLEGMLRLTDVYRKSTDVENPE